jgi:hypothetical protein
MTHHPERRNQIAPPAAAPAMSRSTIRATATSGKPPPVGLAGVAAELAAGVSVGDGPAEALDDGEGVSVGEGDDVGDGVGVGGGVGVDGGGLIGGLKAVGVGGGVGVGVGVGVGIDGGSKRSGGAWKLEAVIVATLGEAATPRCAATTSSNAVHPATTAAAPRIQYRLLSRGM